MAPARRSRLTAVLSALSLATLTAVGSVLLAQSPSQPSEQAAADLPPGSSWVGSWGAALHEAGEADEIAPEGFTDVTLRQVARLSLGGDALRLRLSNVYGDRPLEIGAVTVAVRRGNQGRPRVDIVDLRRVTFDGQESTSIPVGEVLASDPVRVRVPDLADVVVSMHLPGPTGPATWQASAFATSFVAEGEHVTDPGDAFETLDESRYFLAGVDVATDDDDGTVVFVGDSITAGANSSVDADLRYPDQVAARLLGGTAASAGSAGSTGPVGRCGVVNAGIGGNRVLSGSGRTGDPVLDRFDRDVLAVPGVRTVVVLAGINDIGGAEGDLEPEELIDAYRTLVDRARADGVRVIGATLTPFTGFGYATEAGEADRQAVNDWIRSTDELDGVVDTDRVLRDPADPARLRPSYDSGDSLHPSDEGFAAVAAAVAPALDC
ncbi:SGNH/GDSL hydrolase family protein [uncultured Nocardioides sp.]|uniref:SGNH/GDSL hydrolase family protein n=1 Tax=uncultured Nocardioides sp. TaxID=198441 RepID=UPI002607C7D7|nr:SGNH/GDSL hydrolase family protein [uncultured Nocardioides sp.]